MNKSNNKHKFLPFLYSDCKRIIDGLHDYYDVFFTEDFGCYKKDEYYHCVQVDENSIRFDDNGDIDNMSLYIVYQFYEQKVIPGKIDIVDLDE